MIISFNQNSEDLVKAGISKKNKFKLSGKQNLKRWYEYLHSEKVKEGVDQHEGTIYSWSNIPTKLLPPAVQNSITPFKTDKERKIYTSQWAAEKAEFLMNHNNEARRKKKNHGSGDGDGDELIFIASFKESELKNLSTKERIALFDDFRSMFLNKLNRGEENRFFADFDVHLKDTNPHLHIGLGYFDMDGEYHKFHIGKRFEGGMLDFCQDIKYEMEKKYPFLLQMETEFRNKQYNMDDDIEFHKKLEAITAAYSGTSYNYTAAKDSLKANDVGVKFERKSGEALNDDGKKTKNGTIYVLNNLRPEKMKSYQTMPLHMKQFLEKQEYFNQEYMKNKIDLSHLAVKAIDHIINNPNANLKEINKQLLADGLRITPRQSGKAVQWSITFIDYNTSISLSKMGLNPKDKIYQTIFDVTPGEIAAFEREKFNRDYNEKINKNEVQRTKSSKPFSPYVPYTLFRYEDEFETIEHFQKRMRDSVHSNKSLANVAINGDSVVNKYNREMFRRVANHEYELLQNNNQSVRALIQEIVARGDTYIEFTGPSNAAMQEALYIEASLNGVRVKNYTPTLTVQGKLQKLQAAQYDATLLKNVEKIDQILADPAHSGKATRLMHTRKLDRTVDSKPAYHAMLYALHRSPKPRMWAMPNDLLPLTPADAEQIAKRLREDLKIENQKLAELFQLAGFTLPPSLQQYEAEPAPQADTKPAEQHKDKPAPKNKEKAKPDSPDADGGKRRKIKPE